MGWTFPYTTPTRAALVQHLRRPERFGEKFELVRACASGSHHWYLIRERATGLHWIGLDLLQGARGEGWGYKDLDETVGPCAVDCPLAYLDAPHAEREGWAAQWRARVREYHARKSARPALVPGARLRLRDGREYVLAENLGRRGWRVINPADGFGAFWRMPARVARSAELVPAA